MKKRDISCIIAVLIILSTVLSGCGKDKIAEDINTYYPEVQNAWDAEEAAMSSVDEATKLGTNAAVIKALNEVAIPKYDAYVKRLENIRPDTAELREIHEKLIAAANKRSVTLHTLTSGDESKVTEGMAEYRTLLREFNEKLADIQTKHPSK